MEQDHRPSPPGDPLLPSFDRETFARVWRRVMPEDRPDCPFLLDREEDFRSSPPSEPDVPAMSPAEAPAPEPAREPSTALAVPEPAASPRSTPDSRGSAAPLENDVPCLGAASAVHSGQLQRFIDHEIAAWHAYQMLARRAQGSGSRVLASLAADERRHARRLSAAYFLISGVRYWPGDRTPGLSAGTYPAILRERFCAEQKAEYAYLAAAEETADSALRELFLELAGDENAHARLIRGILEQM